MLGSCAASDADQRYPAGRRQARWPRRSTEAAKAAGTETAAAARRRGRLARFGRLRQAAPSRAPVTCPAGTGATRSGRMLAKRARDARRGRQRRVRSRPRPSSSSVPAERYDVAAGRVLGDGRRRRADPRRQALARPRRRRRDRPHGRQGRRPSLPVRQPRAAWRPTAGRAAMEDAGARQDRTTGDKSDLLKIMKPTRARPLHELGLGRGASSTRTSSRTESDRRGGRCARRRYRVGREPAGRWGRDHRRRARRALRRAATSSRIRAGDDASTCSRATSRPTSTWSGWVTSAARSARRCWWAPDSPAQREHTRGYRCVGAGAPLPAVGVVETTDPQQAR